MGGDWLLLFLKKCENGDWGAAEGFFLSRDDSKTSKGGAVSVRGKLSLGREEGTNLGKVGDFQEGCGEG